jgi:outer membrane receptor protein involved in Fe transport
MGPVMFTSSTGYQDRTYAVNLDLGYLPFRFNTNTKYTQFTQEFRFASSNQDAPITYVAGLWYRNFGSQSVRTGTLIANGAPFAPLSRVGDDPVDSKAYAVFGDVTYAASPMFDLSAGMRYYYDERSSTTISPVPSSLSGSFRNFSPKVTAKVKWNDNASSYATISRGFRSGGFNGSGTTFAPETVWNYEIGTKAALLGNALFLDVAGYYLDYQNRQSQGILFISGAPITETRNGGKASGPGVEVGLSAKLPAGLRASINFAYTDVKYDLTTGDVNQGDPFSYVPKFSGAASLSQRIPLGDSFTGYWRVDYQHASNASSIVRSNIVAGVVIPNGNPALENARTGEQDILNLRLGAEIGKFDVSLDVYNILNEDAVTFFTSQPSRCRSTWMRR